MFLKDDMILNYWNLVQADKSKLWITHKVSASWVKVSLDSNSSKWYFKDGGQDTVKKLLSDLPVHCQIKYREKMDEKNSVVCSYEVFYVPCHFVGDFVDLVSLTSDSNLHHEVVEFCSYPCKIK
ncbi:hypothetical protein SUGI_0167730 [Cryptomeria japonica]|nr:hypothetical protein SUGI_0167730 [Cryptomeria japonica]